LFIRVQFNGEFPVSQPILRIFDKIVFWTESWEFEDFEACDSKLEGKKIGVIKCLIVPPRGTEHIPLIPMRDNGRLLFPLCRSCAVENKIGRFDPAYFCQHFEEKDRAFVATIARPELLLALDNGYIVRKIYRCYTFEKYINSYKVILSLFCFRFDSDLFKNYIREFLKVKVESSGWPTHCRTNEFQGRLPDLTDLQLTPEQRQTVSELMANREMYIVRQKEVYGIDIDESKIKVNEGLRYVAKLCLNSLCKIYLYFCY
jgi:hypothetical protein